MRRGGLREKVGRGAPIVCAALLLGALLFGGFDAGAAVGAEEYHERVREAFEEAPYRFDAWVGSDVEAPPAAIKLLRPNRLLQRRYTNLETDRVMSVLLVHCADTRDMLGHYPPRCYPAHGWSSASTEIASFELGGSMYAGTDYRFTRAANGVEQRMRVFGFFVLPDGKIVPDMGELDKAAGRRAATRFGAAQVQVIGGEGLSEEARMDLIERFLEEFEPVIRVIARGGSA